MSAIDIPLDYSTELVAPAPATAAVVGGDTNSNTLGTILTDLGGAAQVGLGIYSETQGGPPVNTTIGGQATLVPGSAVPKTILGFTYTEIVIAVLLIVGVIVAIHYAT
jgi:hypothetical protein